MFAFRYIVLALFFVGFPISLLSGDEAQDGIKANKNRWEAMDASRKKEIIDTYKRWKGLSELKRDAIRSKYEKFRVLGPEQREVVAVNAPRWVHLDEKKRKQIRKYFRSDSPHRQGPPPPPRGFLRVAGTLLEEGREVSMPAIMQRFTEQLAVKNLITQDQIAKYNAAKARKKFEIFWKWMFAQGKKKYPDALDGLEKGSKEYRFACRHMGMRVFFEIANEIFEPTQLEMATFIRFRARRHLGYGKQCEIASYSAEQLDAFVKDVYEKDGIDIIVSKMPERMRTRYHSFDEARKLATIRMVFEPIHKMHGPPRGEKDPSKRPGDHHRGGSDGKFHRKPDCDHDGGEVAN